MESDDEDDLSVRPVRSLLRTWLICLIVMDTLIWIGYFRQYLVANADSQQSAYNSAWYFLILAVAGIVKIVGSVALMVRRKWGIMVFGVGCIAMMMVAFALVESGPIPVLIAVLSAGALWITVVLCTKEGILRR